MTDPLEWLEMVVSPGPQPTINPDGSPRRQVHARRNLSTLFVFRKGRGVTPLHETPGWEGERL